MNKKIFVAAFGLMAVAASAQSIWNGADALNYVESGGYWFSYDDQKEKDDDGPGASSTNFPPSDTTKDVVGPWISDNDGTINVTYTLGVTSYKYPFAGIGFNWTAPESKGMDLTSKGGLCVEYTLSGAVPVDAEIKLPNNASGVSIDGNNAFKFRMKAQASMTKVPMAFSSFKQASGWGVAMTNADALAKSTGIKFKGSATGPLTAAKTGNLVIKSIGWQDECSGGGTPVLNTVAAGAAKFVQSGRTLSFSGVNAGASIDVINMQGQLVSRQVMGATKSVSLSGLANGLYMVRVAGENVNFSQRVILQ